MIIVPKTYTVGPFNKDFLRLIEFFNELEDDLQCPNCEGDADQTRILNKALNELIKWGKV